MLELDHVTFGYPGQPVPYRFTMSAGYGEVTAIRGASGSGKSTLLDLIAGFLTPDAGRIVLNGKDITDLAPQQRPISILFQTESLFEHLSAAHNIALGLPSGTPRADLETKVAAALTEVGLSGIGGQRAETLSGGQKQRVALARTLLRARPVLLLDEPFSALDDETRQATRSLVAELTRRHNWITVLVSHFAEDVAALSARTYTIEDGELVG